MYSCINRAKAIWNCAGKLSQLEFSFGNCNEQDYTWSNGSPTVIFPRPLKLHSKAVGVDCALSDGAVV